MMAIPLRDDGFKLQRGQYWMYLVMIAVFSTLVDMNTTTYDAGNAWLDIFIVASWFSISYGRVKDIGWHGAWCIACIVPLFNIVIGFIRSKPERLTGATYKEIDHVQK